MQAPPPRWHLVPPPPREVVETLAEALKIDAVTATVLCQRGVSTYEEARAFFAPELTALHDPMRMLGMEAAVARVALAQDEGETICVYGDYDVDGTTAVALVSIYLTAVGIKHMRYQPDRQAEGYGLSRPGIDQALGAGARLMIALDCGVKQVELVAHAQAEGLDVILCDHHLPGPILPPSIALLNPKQPGCPYPYKELTGCGIGFKLVQALAAKLTPKPEMKAFDPAMLLDLVALSIACDLVPITGENRILAYYGLEKLRNNPLPGIAALKELHTKQESDRHRRWTISDLVFFLGPRINAMGRLAHARHAAELLLGEADLDHSVAAGLLHQTNADRRALEQEVTAEALAQARALPEPDTLRGLVLADRGWHRGVVGIVASRMVEATYRPAVVLAWDEAQQGWVGSARSVAGFDLYEALVACADHLEQFGGHMYAAGLSVAAGALPHFREAFERVCAERITVAQQRPSLELAAALNFSGITEKFIRIQGRMEPFGPSNLHPLYYSQAVEVQEVRMLQGKHLKLSLVQEDIRLDGIAFGLAERASWLRTGDVVAIAYAPNFNEFRGQKSLQLVVKDIRTQDEELFLEA